MQQLTRTVLRHKRLVAAAWIALTLIGFGAAGPASEALDQKFSVPGREGWETSQRIANTYGNGGESLPLVAVASLPPGRTVETPGVRAELRRVEDVGRQTVAHSRVAG